MSCGVCLADITGSLVLMRCQYPMCENCFKGWVLAKGEKVHDLVQGTEFYNITCPHCRGENHVYTEKYTHASLRALGSMFGGPGFWLKTGCNRCNDKNCKIFSEHISYTSPTDEHLHKQHALMSPVYIGLLPGMLPVPRKNQLFEALGIKWVPISTVPVRDGHQFKCDLCDVRNRAAFPYLFFDTKYDFGDKENSFELFACPQCVLTRADKKIDTDLATLVSYLERHHSVKVPTTAEFLNLCFGKTNKELIALLSALPCLQKPAFLGLNGEQKASAVIPLQEFKALRKILVLCLTARDGNQYQSYAIKELFERTFLPFLVQFRVHATDESNLLHKCLNRAIDYKGVSVEKCALAIYYLRKGVFKGLQPNWDPLLPLVDDFLVHDKWDCVFAPKSPSIPALDEEVKAAQALVQQAEAHVQQARAELDRVSKKQKRLPE